MLDHVADGRVVFPYDEVRIDFVLRAAAYARRRRYGNDLSAARVALVRNHIPHRGPLLEEPSGRLARDGRFCMR